MTGDGTRVKGVDDSRKDRPFEETETTVDAFIQFPELRTEG